MEIAPDRAFEQSLRDFQEDPYLLCSSCGGEIYGWREDLSVERGRVRPLRGLLFRAGAKAGARAFGRSFRAET